MIRVQNGIRNRNPIRSFLLVFALACVSLIANAANLSGWGTSGITSNGGKSFSITPGAGDLRVPIKNPGGGWQTAGNYGVQNGSTGTTFNLGANGDVYRYQPDGTYIKYPMGYSHPTGISAGDIAGAIGGIVGGPLGVACALACPALVDWLTSGGARINDKTGALEKNCTKACNRYTVSMVDGFWGDTQSAACQMHAAYLQTFDYQTRNFEGNGGGYCTGEFKATGATLWEKNMWTLYAEPRTENGSNWYPASMNDILPYMSPRPDPKIIGELLKNGADIPLPKTGGTVTGPSVIDGPSKTTTNPDGSRTVETTKYNFSRSGNTVTNTSNVTTTTTYNIDNSVRNTTTVTTTPTDTTAPKDPNEGKGEEKETEDPCKANPDRIGCMEQDVPEGEIPRSQKEITFAPEDVLGTGACPADVTASFTSAPGLSGVKLIHWQGFCGAALPLRAIIIAMASIMAFFIVMPGGRVE